MLSLEPVFCKSTGAYREQVARFCHTSKKLEGDFKLARPAQPAILDQNIWPRRYDGPLNWAEGLTVAKDVRSILYRSSSNVNAMLSHNGYLLELDNSDLEPLRPVAVTLIRHGFLKANISSETPSGIFIAENFVELITLGDRQIARAILSGRMVDVTDLPLIADLIATKNEFLAEPDQVDTLEHLCRLGLFRQLENT